MEKIQPGKYVELGYDLYKVNVDGTETLMHQSDPSDPEKIIFGVTQGVIVPLEKAIDGLGVGDQFNVVANANEAFGPYDPEQVVELDKEIFYVDGKFDSEMVAVGKYVPMMTNTGYHINGLVKEITDDKVRLDFNHPLAGSTVRFDGKILAVRDATPEELHPQHSCGCGCDHSHGEGGCDHSHGEGGCEGHDHGCCGEHDHGCCGEHDHHCGCGE